MSRFTNWQTIALAAALLILVVTPLAAQQQTGNVHGVVTDAQAAPLPGVTVELTGIGAPKVAITDENGQFRFLSLDPGNYQLRSSLEGFSTVEYPNVNVRVGRSTTLEVQLTAAIEEVITVTSESPLLDERKITAGTTISQVELEKIPTARDPWATLTQTPGVITDRINVGGNESGQQAVFLAGGVSDDENTFAVDGVVITDMAAIGASPTYYDFDQFEEMQVTTGGSDITSITGGVSLNLVTKRGTNQPRGSARYLLTDSDDNFGIFEQAEADIDDELAPGQNPIQGNQIGEIVDFGFEAGGPVLRDRLWAWGSYGRNDIKQFAAGGTPDNTLLENSAVKLNGQIATSNSFVGSWNRGDKIKNGRGAGPTRPLNTTWDQAGPTEIWKVEDTHVFSSSLYATGMFSYVDGGFGLTAKGGTGPSAPEAVLQSNGAWRNTSFLSGASDRNATAYQLDGSYFFNTGNMGHEMKFGASYRDFESESDFTWPGGRDLLHSAGEIWGGVPGTGVVQADRMGPAPVNTEYTALWLQDTVTMGALTLNAGLRYDLQEGANGATIIAGNPVFPNVLPTLDFAGNEAGFEWETISPRLGATYALGAERKTLLRASYSRFAEQLETSDVTRVNPLGTAYAYFYYEDVNDNDVFEPGIDGDPGAPFDFTGFNPNDPTALNSPNINDPSLDPQVTDELIVGVEHALMPELVVGLQGTYRIISDILEARTILSSGGAACTGGSSIHCATRADYSQDIDANGNPVFETVTLPNGETVSVPIFSLSPAANAARTGGSFLTNGGREVEYLGLNVNFTKRLSNRWMARGYFNYAEPTWSISESDLQFFNPANLVSGAGDTGTVGAGDSVDDDGDVFAVQSLGSGSKGDVWLQSSWSANLNGMYQFFPDRGFGFNVAANLFAREGYPLPYFVANRGQDGITRNYEVTGDIDKFRTDDIFVADLRIEKDMAFTDNLSGIVSLDVFNVFNENYVLQRERQLDISSANFLRETLSPRIYRLGFRLNWR